MKLDRATVEACAKAVEAEQLQEESYTDGDRAYRSAIEDAARAVRSLLPTPGEPANPSESPNGSPAQPVALRPAREIAHKFCSDEDLADDCKTGSDGDEGHGVDCNRLTAIIEARDEAWNRNINANDQDWERRLEAARHMGERR